ncbi:MULTISPECIES: Asp23/Gls24 family envelope stress response protein [unclassified Rathayibacter]|uniref:Asp23/Gls24 family envelope stress response protein n=1 Tax=unclassified Rathayibacter TaxID=2609250 RepID=UPI000CE73B70|nr:MULTISPECIES: Asp23/Gls24 family envelope stress response protein [unclassified Rathayibacter]PPG18161.1 Asp23/Gls24 family protein [Rathayibacter sp. AY1C6]PPG52280.1 Asp23/Gls24 family protein [Rathayibacter sp. AY2B7]PPH89691.1 Asp23/Gls24 family protein [Rathayibacter sp. AY1D5]PPI15736.1 Asp23/Gls24 family protein [Rathayibacter sp. AY1D2]
MSDPMEPGTVERIRTHEQPTPNEQSRRESARRDGKPSEPESTESRVATAAGESAQRVSGVHHLGGAVARGLDRASRRVLGTSTVPGVTVSKADGVTTVDIDLVVEYPHPVREVLDAVRDQVQRVAEPVAGGHVVVNVEATDVHGPFDPIEKPEEDKEPLVDTAKRAASDARDSAKEAAGNARDAVSGAVDSARGRLADAADDAADAMDRAADERDERAAAQKTADAERAAERDEDDPRVETHAAPAVVETAEFVVRVQVEPVDDDGDPRTATVEVAPAEEPEHVERDEAAADRDDASDDADAHRSEDDRASSAAGRE